MKVRFRKKSHKTRDIRLIVGRFEVIVRVGVSTVTGNLFFNGKVNGSPIIGFVNKAKRGSIGGYVLECDGIGKRDTLRVVTEIVSKCKFNGFPVKPPKRGK